MGTVMRNIGRALMEVMMADDDKRKDCPPAIVKQLSWSRWLVSVTMVIALGLGFVVTRLSVMDSMSDIREIKERVRSIEKKVDMNTNALLKVEKLEGIDLVPGRHNE